jgi:hypothetical protein
LGYEYMILDGEYDDDGDLVAALNKLGTDGWRIVSGSQRECRPTRRVSSSNYAIRARFVMERESPND